MNNYESYTPHIDTNDEPQVVTPEITDIQEKKTQRGGNRRNQAKSKKQKDEKSRQKPEQSIVSRIKNYILSPAVKQITGIFLGCLAVYLLISFISYFTACIKDQSIINSTPVGGAVRISNHGGEGGARLSEFLINKSFGIGSFVIIVWLFAMSLKLLVGRPRFKSVNFTIKCFVVLITLSLIVGISSVVTNTYVNWGGYHAHYVYEFINSFLGYGSYILCFFMVALFVIICLNDLITWIRRKYNERAEKRRIAAEEREAERARAEALLRDEQAEQIDDIKAGETYSLKEPETDDLPEDDALVSFKDGYVLDEEEEITPVNDEYMPAQTISESNDSISALNETDNDTSINRSDDTNSDDLSDTNKEMSDNSKQAEDIKSESSDSGDEAMVVNVNQIDQNGKRL